MGTPYSNIYESFFMLLERDPDFFNYYNLTEEQAMEVATQRAKRYLDEAVVHMARRVELDFNIESRDDVGFEATLTDEEVDLLANIMFERYLFRGVARLQAQSSYLTSQDLTYIHSPANERTSFRELYKEIKYNNETKLDDYASRDRLTGKFKTIDNSVYLSG